MKKSHVAMLVLTGLVLSSFASANPLPKYKVVEVASPVASHPECLPGYAIRVNGGGVSDRGLIVGTGTCYRITDVGNNVFLPYPDLAQSFVWTRRTGGTEVPVPPDTFSQYLLSVDRDGNVYGWQTGATGLNGIRWTQAGGFENVITKAPDCFLAISLAVFGNTPGNVTGAAFRQDGVSEPTDFSCVLRWVFRTADGTEVVGPASSQTPSRMNQRNVVVGQVGNSATKWYPLRNELVTLDQSSPGFISSAFGINDRNVAVGFSGVLTPETVTCWSDTVALLWGRDNEGRVLPSLPRTTSAQAWSIDNEGTVYGLSNQGADSCERRGWETGIGTIWRNGRAFDVNKQLAGRPGVTITTAAFSNERGQVMAYGYRTNDPPKQCPELVTPADGSDPYNVPGLCRDQRVYLLTPED